MQVIACQRPDETRLRKDNVSQLRDKFGQWDLFCSKAVQEQQLTLHNETEDYIPEPVSVSLLHRHVNQSVFNVSWSPVPHPNGGIVLYYEILINWHVPHSLPFEV